jgi:hypothetical protein
MSTPVRFTLAASLGMPEALNLTSSSSYTFPLMFILVRLELAAFLGMPDALYLTYSSTFSHSYPSEAHGG